MTLTIFLDFRHVAGATALCAPAGVLTALLPGSARFESVQGVWRFLDVFFGPKRLNFRIFGFCIFSEFFCFSCASLQRRGLCPNLRLKILRLWLCQRFQCVVAGLDRCSMFLWLAAAEFSTTGFLIFPG